MPQADHIDFSPRQDYVGSLSDTQRAERRMLMASPEMKRVIQAVIADMVVENNSRERLDGALIFIEKLNNFTEPRQVPAQMPVKSLKTV